MNLIAHDLAVTWPNAYIIGNHFPSLSCFVFDVFDQTKVFHHLYHEFHVLVCSHLGEVGKMDFSLFCVVVLGLSSFAISLSVAF